MSIIFKYLLQDIYIFVYFSVLLPPSYPVLYAHEQCLLCFGHCADIWYEGALYLQRASESGVSCELCEVHCLHVSNIMLGNISSFLTPHDP